MYLGIDLGTSNSAIVGHVDGKTKLFKTTDGRDVLPSAIYMDSRGRRFVGQTAYERQIVSPQNVATGFKRVMGTDTPIKFAGQTWRPEDCSAEILRTLVAQAELESGGGRIEGTVITIPAAFNQMQSEATIRAAQAAGLDQVTLLQEPIAASLASLAENGGKDGVFLVYDLGGGTFDVALVRATAGSVNIIANDGVGMLGGRDFDRRIMNAMVRPWLLGKFDLPEAFESDPQYRRLGAAARFAVEKAKIELSSASTATVFASEDDIRVEDASGSPIYLEIDIDRTSIERLIEDRVGETVALCRKILDDNGIGYEDVDRLVLIGGPTKMPGIRERIGSDLGIAVQHGTDPMTAVATGAAIFAESREWQGVETTRKASNRREKTSEDLQLEFAYNERVSAPTARLRIRKGRADVGAWAEVRDESGRTTGRQPLERETTFELKTDRQGPNRFQVVIYDQDGRTVDDAGREITIHRTEASVSIIPATYSLAIKVQAGEVGNEYNSLERLLTKGDPLPASGVKTVRAAKPLRGGERDAIRIEFFDQAEDLKDPALNLAIGAFELDAAQDLDPGERISRGEEMHIHWKLSDNSLLEFSVEVPSLHRMISARNLYVSTGSHANFEGRSGARLADSMLDAASSDIDSAAEAFDGAHAEELARLRRRLDHLTDELSTGVDPEIHRQVSTEARRVRQEVAILKRRPENRQKALLADIRSIDDQFQKTQRFAEAIEIERFDKLFAGAERAIRQNDHDAAERAIEEMRGVMFAAMGRDPQFLAAVFVSIADDAHLAIDARRHAALVEEGESAMRAGDAGALRAVLGQMFANLLGVTGVDPRAADLADLLRG